MICIQKTMIFSLNALVNKVWNDKQRADYVETVTGALMSAFKNRY